MPHCVVTRSPMLAQHANSLRAVCTRIASTACVYTQAGKLPSFSPAKDGSFCLQGAYPPVPLKRKMQHPKSQRRTAHFAKNLCRIRHIKNRIFSNSERTHHMDKHRNKNRSRKYGIVIHLSEDEKYILDEKTKCSNMKSRSAFIRHLILYGYVYDVNYDHLREYNAQLARIGNNLNQIAKRMNATGNVYQADVKEVKELMKQVWQSQKSMLSRQPSIKQ